MHECNKCSEFGFRFKRNYRPVDFIEGKSNSEVWIIGLNPAADQDWEDERTTKELADHLNDKDTIGSYFKDFKSVSEKIFNDFGENKGTAHTDIVKCSSNSFPPESAKGKKAHIVINNCIGFLKTQIQTNKPKIIVCNGAAVSKFMLEFLPPPEGFSRDETSYWSDIDGTKVCVILSGFIGRIDNYARRRLGKEIELRLGESRK
jgi:uracil-DNA glycosylase